MREENVYIISFPYSSVRGVYMALPSSYYEDPVAILIAFEVPSILFFVMYMTLLYIWCVVWSFPFSINHFGRAEVIYKVKAVKAKMGKVKKVWTAYLIVNAVMLGALCRTSFIRVYGS